MLFNDNGVQITKVARKLIYNSFLKKISPSDYLKIVDELNSIIDDNLLKGSEINTAGWIPGNDWIGTIYEPISSIYGGDREASGKMFGIIVWKTFMDRSDKWGFGRYDVKNKSIKSMTYFRINQNL